MIAALILSIVVGTWNGNWFPSGRAEHRAHPEVEAATIKATAKMLAEGIAKMDPEGNDDVILILNEIRGPRVASNLMEQIGRKGLKVASISAYRRRDRFDQQQDVVVTTLPVVSADWKNWSNRGKETCPRGFARARVVIEPSVTAAVYAVHLKSNYGQGKNQEAARLNRVKRAHAVEEFVQMENGEYVIFGGDFNADKWKKEFSEERIFAILEGKGYLNLLGLLPPGNRGTHPNRRWGDSALDYIMARGFDSAAMPIIYPNEELSDHFALFTRLDPR